MSNSYQLFGPFKLVFNGSPILQIFDTPIRAGFPSPAEDYLMKALDLNDLLLKPPESNYGFYVKGESMADVDIHTGDIVVVNTEIERKIGKIVVAGINNDWAVKVLGFSDGKPALVSKNPAFPPILIRDYDELRVFGVVKGLVRLFKV